MTVRHASAFCLALGALLLAAGCGGNGNTATGDETNDPVYQQAQDLKKQGRYNEALNAFLKEIDRRGENGAPESHLEAGALYLNWSHNPVEAYHHFSKYLELQPTGPRAGIVRGQRDAAMREIARFLLAPANGQGVGGDRNEEIDQLRRQVEELKAENQTLRGASSVPVVRSTPMIALPDENSPVVAAEDASPVLPAANPPPNADTGFIRNFPPAAATAPRATQPAASGSLAARPGAAPAYNRPAPAAAVSTPTHPTAPQRPGANAAPASGQRVHTVVAGEKSLWGIARRYYPAVNQARVTAIFEANRDVMRSPNDLRAGMVLRIP